MKLIIWCLCCSRWFYDSGGVIHNNNVTLTIFIVEHLAFIRNIELGEGSTYFKGMMVVITYGNENLIVETNKLTLILSV